MKFTSLLVSSLIIMSSLSSCADIVNKNKEKFAENNFSETKQSKAPKLEVEEFTLDNGLKVYLNRNTESPRFRAEIVVHAGSKFDPPDATGIAHYLEHMLFKGSDKLGTVNYEKEKPLLDEVVKLYDQRFVEKDEKVRRELEKKINALTIEASKYAIGKEIASVYAKLGGKALNAYTDADETVYIVDLPKNRLEQWAKIESNRFENPVFRLFQPELEIVYEEKNRGLDNKEWIVWEGIDKLLFKKHPYGTQSTIGTIEHLKNPSMSKMYEFYNKYYVPNNMAIILSGDIDVKQAKEILTRYFSVLKNKPLPKYEPVKEEPLVGVKKENVYYKSGEKVVIGFRAINKKNKDKYVLELLQQVLDNAEAGLINLDLSNKEKVKSAYAYMYSQDDYGSFLLGGEPKDGQTVEEVENLLLAELEKIKKGDFDESLVNGIILAYEKGKKALLESNEGRAGIMKDAFLTGESVDEVFNFSDKFKSITKKDIVNVANKYFSDNYVVLYRRDKDAVFQKVDKPDIKKITLNNNQKSNLANEVENLKVNPIEPKWMDYNKDFSAYSYAPASVFYHTYNPLNDLFNLYISYEYGSKKEPHLCQILDELNFAGVDKMSPDDVKKELFKMGISYDVSCGDYNSSISISGIDSKFEDGLKLVEKIVWNAKLNQGHLKEKVANIITRRKNAKKDVNTLMGALGSYIEQDKKSPYIDRLSKEELEKISVNEYQKIKTNLLKYNFDTYYTGTLPPEKVESLLRKYHIPQNIKLPLISSNGRPPYELVERHKKPVKIYFLDYKGAQAHINLIIPEDKLNTDEAVISRFYNQYMSGGMSAVMFQEIREARSLAYSTSSSYYQGSSLGDQDEMTGYIGTQSDKTVEALKTFIDVIKNPPETEKHFERSKDAVENGFRTDYKSFRSFVSSFLSWQSWGFDTDPRPERFEQINKVSMKDFKDYVNKKINSKNLTFTIVGDKTKIDMNALKKIGELEEVSIDKLFTD